MLFIIFNIYIYFNIIIYYKFLLNCFLAVFTLSEAPFLFCFQLVGWLAGWLICSVKP